MNLNPSPLEWILYGILLVIVGILSVVGRPVLWFRARRDEPMSLGPLVRRTTKLKEVREAKGVTQQELANRMGVSLVTVVNIEGRACYATGRTLRAFARVLGVTLDDLFDETTVPARKLGLRGRSICTTPDATSTRTPANGSANGLPVRGRQQAPIPRARQRIAAGHTHR